MNAPGSSFMTFRKFLRNHVRAPVVFPFIAECGHRRRILAGARDLHEIIRHLEQVRVRPEEANVLAVAGPITSRLAPRLVAVHDRLKKPSRVVALGACACSGGFWDEETVCPGIDHLIPVDFYVPGCPPHDAVLCRLEELPSKL